MKKLILALAIALGLTAFSAPAKAQYTAGQGQSCNTTLSDGFATKRGDGPNGALAIRYYIVFHYSPADLEKVKRELPTVYTDSMNGFATDKGMSSRFSSVNYVEGQTGEQGSFNFTVYLDVYNNGGTYSVYTSVGGWNAGHLFHFHTTSEGDPTDAFVGSITGLAARLNNGWTCGS